MKTLVSGSSGLIGSALAQALTASGHAVTRLVRSRPREGEVAWDPAAGTIDAAGLEGHDAVVHLAGETVAGRWTAARKARIRDSRVKGTALLCHALAALREPPDTLISASAVGLYGDRGGEILTEQSAPGRGFLPELCRDWEAATEPARCRGIRVVNLRFGVVLARQGGMLARLLPPFRLGLGGVVGTGHQLISWVALDDAVRVIEHALGCPQLDGPVNVVAPHPVTNREFTKALGRALRRPTLLRVPAWLVRLLLGQMGKELLLASARVEPRRLLDSGFQFRCPDLAAALHDILGG